MPSLDPTRTRSACVSSSLSRQKKQLKIALTGQQQDYERLSAQATYLQSLRNEYLMTIAKMVVQPPILSVSYQKLAPLLPHQLMQHAQLYKVQINTLIKFLVSNRIMAPLTLQKLRITSDNKLKYKLGLQFRHFEGGKGNELKQFYQAQVQELFSNRSPNSTQAEQIKQMQRFSNRKNSPNNNSRLPRQSSTPKPIDLKLTSSRKGLLERLESRISHLEGKQSNEKLKLEATKNNIQANLEHVKQQMPQVIPTIKVPALSRPFLTFSRQINNHEKAIPASLLNFELKGEKSYEFFSDKTQESQRKGTSTDSFDINDEQDEQNLKLLLSELKSNQGPAQDHDYCHFNEELEEIDQLQPLHPLTSVLTPRTSAFTSNNVQQLKKRAQESIYKSMKSLEKFRKARS